VNLNSIVLIKHLKGKILTAAFCSSPLKTDCTQRICLVFNQENYLWVYSCSDNSLCIGLTQIIDIRDFEKQLLAMAEENYLIEKELLALFLNQRIDKIEKNLFSINLIFGENVLKIKKSTRRELTLERIYC